MTTMIERVARAIYESWNGRGCTPWSRLTAAHKAPYLSDARTAIKAMREPSDLMGNGLPPDYHPGTHSATQIWRAMIDAALKKG